LDNLINLTYLFANKVQNLLKDAKFAEHSWSMWQKTALCVIRSYAEQIKTTDNLILYCPLRSDDNVFTAAVDW